MSSCRTRCGPCTGTRTRSSRRPAPPSCSSAAGWAAPRSGVGSAWGVQFHADVDAPTLDSWYERYGDWLAEAGVETAAARAADAAHLPGQPQTAEAIFGGFVRRARAARTRAPR